MKIFLDTTRNGYTTEQCGRTLTVKDLRELLEDYNDDTEVFFRNDNGYTYGSLDYDTIREENEY